MGGVGGAAPFRYDHPGMGLIVVPLGVGLSDPGPGLQAAAVVLAFDDDAAPVRGTHTTYIAAIFRPPEDAPVYAIVELLGEVVTD